MINNEINFTQTALFYKLRGAFSFFFNAHKTRSVTGSRIEYVPAVVYRVAGRRAAPADEVNGVVEVKNTKKNHKL